MSHFYTMPAWVETTNNGTPIDPTNKAEQWQGPDGVIHNMDVEASQLRTLCGIHTTEAWFHQPSKAWTFTTRAPTCLTCMVTKNSR